MKYAYRFLFLGICLFLFSFFSLAQTGAKGKVKTEKGKPLPGVTITIFKDGVEAAEGTTDEKGEFLVQGLEGGIYSFVFEKDGFDSANLKRMQILKGQIRDFGKNLVLRVSDNSMYVVFRASVFDQDGLAVRGARIEVAKLGGDSKKLGSYFTNDAGEITARYPDQVATFRVTAFYPNQEPVSGEISIEGAGMYHKALRLTIPKPPKGGSPQ
jgi:hypothetical protein